MPYFSDDSLTSTSCSSLDTQTSLDDSTGLHESADTINRSEDICNGNSRNEGARHQQHYKNANVEYNEGRTICDFPELTSVQIELTMKLMEGERRRVLMLARELELLVQDSRATKFQADLLRQNIKRAHLKYLSLDQEYRESCKMALLRRMRMSAKPSRSQPAIGVKQTSKPRPSIFDALTRTESLHQDNKQNREFMDPQMMTLAQMFGSSTGYVGTDNNNHKQPDRNRDALVFQNGNLHSGPLEALIHHLVPTADYCPDRAYTFAFLLSSRLFIRPHELLAEVCKLCLLQQNLAQDNLHNHMGRFRPGKFGPHIINLLSEWTDTFPYDFREDRMMKQLRDITQRILVIYPDLRKNITNLSYNLITKLTNLKSYEENLARIEAEEQQKAQTQVVARTDIMEVCPSPLLLAQQLTHVELERLSAIGPEEFVQAFCKERTKCEDTKCHDTKVTHNLESYVKWFNRLSYLVASEITSHMKKKNRVKVVEYFIDVAKECINIGNFNSLMAIIAGMNLSPVTRLKKMWSKVNRDKLKILEHQMDPSNNFGSYRSCLKAAMWRSQGALDDREKIVIPFFSLFVKDLYFLNEGCSSRQEDGSVNFHKCWQMAKQVSDLVSWQQVECPFDKCPAVINYILTVPVYKESMLSMASYECETPETSYDKEKYKQLKSQTSTSSL